MCNGGDIDDGNCNRGNCCINDIANFCDDSDGLMAIMMKLMKIFMMMMMMMIVVVMVVVIMMMMWW